MKIPIKNILAGLAGLTLAVPMQAAVITHFDINFNSYSAGPLPPTGWTIPGTMTATVEEGSGNKWLGLTSTAAGSLVLSTATKATPPTVTLSLAPSSEYQWSFSFLLPTNSLSMTNPALIRLDSGAAADGRYLAGLAIRSGELAYLTNPNVAALNSQMTTVSSATWQLQENVWYQATFDITTSAGLGITYDLSITGGTTPFNITGITYTPSALAAAQTVRSAFGSASATGANVKVDNLYLATVPEPSALALVGAALVGLAVLRRRTLPQE